MTGKVTRAPLAYLSDASQVSLAVPLGSRPWTLSFQARSFSSEVRAAAGGASPAKLPMTEMPVLPVLKPSTWAPTTPLFMPP